MKRAGPKEPRAPAPIVRCLAATPGPVILAHFLPNGFSQQYGKLPVDLIIDFLSCVWEYTKEQISKDTGAVADLGMPF